jgi:hypothetical protein
VTAKWKAFGKVLGKILGVLILIMTPVGLTIWGYLYWESRPYVVEEYEFVTGTATRRS